MSQPHNRARWRDSEQLAPDVRCELAAYAAEAPRVERRARMLASLEQQLGFSDAPSAQAPSAEGGQPALGGGAASTGAGAATGAIFKLKLVLSALATVGASLGLFAGWSAVNAVPAIAPALHRADEVSTPPPSFRATPPAFARWVSEVSRLAPEPAATATHASAPRASVLLATRAPRESPTVQRARSERRPPEPVAQVEPTVPAEAPLPVEPASVGHATDALSELTLLAHARRALLAQPERSLALAEQHASEFPNGTLCEEREVLAIESLLKLGLGDRAKQRALLFEQRFPNSAHRAHLARMIALQRPAARGSMGRDE